MRILFFIQRCKFILLVIACIPLLACASHPPTHAPLPPSSQKTEGFYHTVEKGQTLWRICKTYKAHLQEVAELNNIKNPDKIKAGDKIFIPGAKHQLPVTITPTDAEQPEQKIVISKGMFSWPVKGSIVTQFGVVDGYKNDGIDISAPSGSAVSAAGSGKVEFSSNLKGYGNTIIIRHPDKFATVYANNQVNLVKSGEEVKKGQMIAKVGTSNGKVDSPHLHFQVREKNQPRNPMFYLP
jgi:lipoprotein NlpD